MSEFKGTRGEVFTRDNTDSDIISVEHGLIATCYNSSISFFKTITLEESLANRDLIVDAFKVRQQINCELSELLEMYKECFELFIPMDKWDEATEFLSTYGSGLAKNLKQKEK